MYDKSRIFKNYEDGLKEKLKANLKMLDELQLSISTVSYCENDNDFGSIIDQLETSNFLARFHRRFLFRKGQLLRDVYLERTHKYETLHKATLENLGTGKNWLFKWHTMKEVIKEKAKQGECPSHMHNQMKVAMPFMITIAIIALILLIPWLKHRKNNEQIRCFSNTIYLQLNCN